MGERKILAEVKAVGLNRESLFVIEVRLGLC